MICSRAIVEPQTAYMSPYHLGTFLFTFLSLILIIWGLDGFTVTNMTRYVSLRDEKESLKLGNKFHVS